LFRYLLAVVLTLALAACGGTTPGYDTPGTNPAPGNALELSAPVEGYSGAGGDVIASLQNSLAQVTSGTLTSAGLLTLELPAEVSSDKLSQYMFCLGNPLTYSAPSYALDLLAPLEVREGATTTGTLSLSNKAGTTGGSQLGLEQLIPLYSDTALTVKGVCHDLDYATTYDLQLEPGWNFTLLKVTDELGTKATHSTVGEIPAEVSWQFVSASAPLSARP